jgi:hypothetical protein
MTTNRLRKKGSRCVVFVDQGDNEVHRVSAEGINPEAIHLGHSVVFFRLPSGRQLFSATCIRMVGPMNCGDVRVTLKPISDSDALAQSLKKATP